PDLFIESVTRAQARGLDVHGLLVGDGPLRRDVEALISRRRAPITAVGFLNQGDMSRAYVAADAMVLPSTHDTWGLVVNEAMASGLPTVVSDGVGCSDDLVTPGETGSVFPVGDLDALTDCLADLAADRDRLARLGEQARGRIEAFSIDAAAD